MTAMSQSTTSQIKCLKLPYKIRHGKCTQNALCSCCALCTITCVVRHHGTGENCTDPNVREFAPRSVAAMNTNLTVIREHAAGQVALAKVLHAVRGKC